MPITLNCTCGKMLRVADEHAGKRVKCPACNSILSATVPEEPAFEVVEDEPKQSLTAAKPVKKARVDDDDDEDGSYGVKKAKEKAPPPKKKPSFRKSADDDDDEEEERPRRRKRRRSSSSARDDFNSARLGYIVGGVLTAIVGVAIAYFLGQGEGRSATRGLIFGIILAICGLVSVVKGITDNIDEDD